MIKLIGHINPRKNIYHTPLDPILTPALDKWKNIRTVKTLHNTVFIHYSSLAAFIDTLASLNIKFTVLTTLS